MSMLKIPAVIKPSEWVEELRTAIQRERHQWLAAGYYDENIPIEEIESDQIEAFLERLRDFGSANTPGEQSRFFAVWMKQMNLSLNALKESNFEDFLCVDSAEKIRDGIAKEIEGYQ
jgi:hypothetical protein